MERGTDKAALVTGAGSGLGRALSGVFAAGGWDLVLHARDQAALENLKSRIGSSCGLVAGDLRAPETLARLGEAAKARGVRVLVNNAGAYLRKPLAETSETELREILEVNLVVPMLLTRNLLPVLARNGDGLVININSLAGKTGGEGETAYAASKHGLAGFSRALQFEATRAGVRVCDVFLGAMNTEMVKDRKDPAKCIQPDEAARLVVQLCECGDSLRVSEVELLRTRY